MLLTLNCIKVKGLVSKALKAYKPLLLYLTNYFYYFTNTLLPQLLLLLLLALIKGSLLVTK